MKLKTTFAASKIFYGYGFRLFNINFETESLKIFPAESVFFVIFTTIFRKKITKYQFSIFLGGLKKQHKKNSKSNLLEEKKSGPF